MSQEEYDVSITNEGSALHEHTVIDRQQMQEFSVARDAATGMVAYVVVQDFNKVSNGPLCLVVEMIKAQSLV